MVTDPSSASAAEIAGAVVAGEISATAVTEAALAAIALRNPALNAFTAVTADRARARAKAIDAQRAQGRPLGPLAGVPYAVKNLFDVKGLPTLAGSKINRDLAPAARDATLITRLEAQSGVDTDGFVEVTQRVFDVSGEAIKRRRAIGHIIGLRDLFRELFQMFTSAHIVAHIDQ